MPAWITLALQIWKNITDCVNRETSADEKIKDHAVKELSDDSKAGKCARLLFDGDRKFPGVDNLAKQYFSEKEYKEYIKRKNNYNKHST